MARIPFLGRLTGNNTSPQPPLGNTPETLPTEQLLGHTAPTSDPGLIRPGIGTPPRGASGRANFYGLPQWDELNPKLTGQRGLSLFDDMYWSDAHVRRLVLACWSPLTAGTWTLEPYGGEDATDQDRKIAEAIWWALTEFMAPNFYGHLYEVGPALLRFGFVPFEQQWATCQHDGQTLLVPSKLGFMLPRTIWRWWQDDWGDMTHIGQILPNKPDVVVPTSDLTYYRLASEGDNWMGRSLLRHAYKHWYLKDKLERIQAIGCERSAKGVPIAYVSPDMPAQTRSELEMALANMHVSEVGYLVLPAWKMGMAPQEADPANQAIIDVIQYNSASDDAIKGAIDYHQIAISSSFLTDFLELGHHQVGARATAEVQEDPFLTAINGALLPPVLPPLNALVDRIRKLNWEGADGSPQLKLTLHDEASLSEIATYVQQLVAAEALGVDPELEDWLRDRGGLPPANPAVRAQRQAAQKAAMENAANAANELPLDSNGEPKGSEPPNPDDTKPPAKPAATQKPKPQPQKPQPGKQLDAPSPPPNLRVSDSDESQQPEQECGTCRMFNHGVCWGYGNTPVDGEWVCDSWELSPSAREQDAEQDEADGVNPKTPAAAGSLLDAPAPLSGGTTTDAVLQMVPETGDDECVCPKRDGKRVTAKGCPVHGTDKPAATQLDATAEPTVKWWERLLSQDRLREALDGARDHIQAAVQPQALLAARQLAHQAANGAPLSQAHPAPELTDALTKHYTDMYALGHDTVQVELAKQRTALGKQLDEPPPADVAAGAGVADRLARARQRGEHSARNIINAITGTLGRDQITGLKDPAALQAAAEQAATGALRLEAVMNTAAMINDGRNAAGTSASDVVGAYYVSVLDERSCSECEKADDGSMLTPEDAVALGPPNPLCAGQDRCRCVLLWVLADDPSVVQAIT